MSSLIDDAGSRERIQGRSPEGVPRVSAKGTREGRGKSVIGEGRGEKGKGERTEMEGKMPPSGRIGRHEGRVCDERCDQYGFS